MSACPIVTFRTVHDCPRNRRKCFLSRENSTPSARICNPWQNSKKIGITPDFCNHMRRQFFGDRRKSKQLASNMGVQQAAKSVIAQVVAQYLPRMVAGCLMGYVDLSSIPEDLVNDRAVLAGLVVADGGGHDAGRHDGQDHGQMRARLQAICGPRFFCVPVVERVSVEGTGGLWQPPLGRQAAHPQVKKVLPRGATTPRGGRPVCALASTIYFLNISGPHFVGKLYRGETPERADESFGLELFPVPVVLKNQAKSKISTPTFPLSRGTINGFLSLGGASSPPPRIAELTGKAGTQWDGHWDLSDQGDRRPCMLGSALTPISYPTPRSTHGKSARNQAEVGTSTSKTYPFASTLRGRHV